MDSPKVDITFDRNNLYLEETFSDLQSGSIKRFVPVTVDGSPDASRTPVFMAQAQIMSAAGPLPIQCALEANNLDEAIKQFPAAIQETVDKLIEEAQRLRREEASRIVVPGQEAVNKIIR